MICMRCDKPMESGEHRWTLELQDWGPVRWTSNDQALSVPMDSSAMRVTLCESCAKKIVAEVKRPGGYTLRVGNNGVTAVPALLNTDDCEKAKN